MPNSTVFDEAYQATFPERAARERANQVVRQNAIAGGVRVATNFDLNNPLTTEAKSVERKTSVKSFFTSISDYFGKRGFQGNKYEDFIGIEIENETITEFHLPKVLGWDFHQEGSLRNFGFEYVQNPPKPILETEKLLTNLLSCIKKNLEASQIISCSNSVRTSTHVHFDVTKYNFFDLINFACVYWILEEFLSHFCGDGRKGNLFCLRMKDTAFSQNFIANSIKSKEPWGFPLTRNEYRYSSINFASIPKFGSLEFRIMRGSDDKETILSWVKALNAIRLFSLKFKNPAELKSFFLKEIDAKNFPCLVLGEELYVKLLLHRQNKESLEKEIRRGFMSVHHILSSDKDFDFSTLLKEEEEEESKKKAGVKIARVPDVQRGAGGGNTFIYTNNLPEGEDNALDTLLVEDNNLIFDNFGDM